MAPSRKPQNIGEVLIALDAIDSRLSARDELDAERRKVDDLRDAEQQAVQRELLQRTDKLETNWESFFGEQGAFRMVINQLKGHSKKIDRLTWIAGVGVGIAIVVQIWLQTRGVH